MLTSLPPASARGRVSGIAKYAPVVMTAPASNAKPNTLRQPSVSISIPPTIGDTIGPSV